MTSSLGPSPCSVCINPNSLVFNLNRIDNSHRAIDIGAARLLLAAAKIAAKSMSKAEVAAAMEAERRCKDASYTKKRAREALDLVVKLMVKEKRSFGVVKGNNNNSYKKVINVANVVNDKMDASCDVLNALNDVELENGVVIDAVVQMEVDVVVNGKDGGVNIVVETGCVKTDALVSNGQEQALENVNVVEENGVINPNI